jgi:hypothetical protein
MRLFRVITITVVSLIGAGGVEAATLTWDRNPESDVRGYVIEYGTQSGNHSTSVDVGNVLTHVLSPPSGQRYYIVVRAYNASGVGPKSSEVVLDLTTTVVTNQPPTLSLPPNQTGTVGSVVRLALTGADPEGGTLLYSAGGLPPGLAISSASGLITGTLQTAGTYTVTVTVSDTKLTATQSFTWVVTPSATAGTADTTPPVVTIMSPAHNETVSKNVKLRAAVTDAGGVKSVRYLLNGVALSEEITTTPYQYNWTLAKVADGSYQLTARATDNAGNVGTRTITVIVKDTNGNGKNSLTEAEDSASGDESDAQMSPDVPVSADFDGDGQPDPGTYTAMTGEWRLWLSSYGYRASEPMLWGTPEDMPVPADYDGDGRADLAVFRPASGTWSIVASNNGKPSRLEIPWGRMGDTPIAFDYDHDGRADLALRRPAGFDVLLSSTNYATSVTLR